MLLTVFVWTCLTATTAGTQDVNASKDLSLMQGEWEVIFVYCKPERTKGWYQGWRLIVKDTTMIFSGRNLEGEIQEGRSAFLLRPELSPKGIDFLDNRNDIPPQYGIYDVTPYILVIYVNEQPGGPRPKNFALPKADQDRYMMMVFRRVK
jgi:hypothetical protein